jgi:hypothetical protein
MPVQRSVIGGKPEKICSVRGLPPLTQSRRDRSLVRRFSASTCQAAQSGACLRSSFWTILDIVERQPGPAMAATVLKAGDSVPVPQTTMALSGCRCQHRIERARDLTYEIRDRGPGLNVPSVVGAAEDAVNAEEHLQRYTSTGIFECVSTLTVSLQRTTAETPRRPWEAITIKSHFLASAASIIA